MIILMESIEEPISNQRKRNRRARLRELSSEMINFGSLVDGARSQHEYLINALRHSGLYGAKGRTVQ
jgi:hypothetical protein